MLVGRARWQITSQIIGLAQALHARIAYGSRRGQKRVVLSSIDGDMDIEVDVDIEVDRNVDGRGCRLCRSAVEVDDLAADVVHLRFKRRDALRQVDRVY